MKNKPECGRIMFFKLLLPSRELIQVSMSDAKIISTPEEIHFKARSKRQANEIADSICSKLKI